MINQSYRKLMDENGETVTYTGTGATTGTWTFIGCSCVPSCSELRDDWKEQREYVHQKMREMEHPVRSYLSNQFARIVGKIIKKFVNLFYKQE